MVQNRIIFSATRNQPNPDEIDYWVDLTENPYGGVIKYYNGSQWIKLQSGGANLDNYYNKQQVNQLLNDKADASEVNGKVSETLIKDLIKNISFDTNNPDQILMVLLKYDNNEHSVTLPIASQSSSGIVTSKDFNDFVKQHLLQELNLEIIDTLTSIIANYLKKLIAGDNITIDPKTNVISATGAVSMDWNNITNKPDFKNVAITGDYNDLTNKLKAGQGVNIDESNTISVTFDESGTLQQTIENINLSIKNVDSKVDTHVADKNNPHQVTKQHVLLGNVTNDAQVKRSEMGVANGVATLNSTGKIPETQLPSYVDDVIEAANKTSFPENGESGKIYVSLEDNKTYRWSGTAYVEISQSLALGETSSTAYAGNKGKKVTDDLNSHLSDFNNPHRVTAEHVGLGNVNNTSDLEKPVSNAVQQLVDNTKRELEELISSSGPGGDSAVDISKLTERVAKVETTASANATNIENHIKDYDNPHKVTKNHVGLENVDNTSDVDKPVSNATQTLINNTRNQLDGKINNVKSEIESSIENVSNQVTQINNSIGVTNGIATLDGTGKVPTSQLPSYVDDVIEFESRTQFPSTGEPSKIYMAKDANTIYRWSGSEYIQISSASLTLGETANTAYAGDKGKYTRDTLNSHVSNYLNPHNVTKAQIGLAVVDNTSDLDKPVSTATQSALNNKVDKEPGKLLSTEDFTTEYKRKLDSLKGAAIERYEHAELFAKYKAGTLIPWQYYAITNYACVYKTMKGDEVSEIFIGAQDVKELILLATDTNKFAEEVLCIRKEEYVPIVKCLYDIDAENVIFSKGITKHTARGVIYYMEDANGNACNYDFKHVKFYRFAVNDITPEVTPNDSHNSSVSPYYCYIDENYSYVPADVRYFVGCGDSFDKLLINGIFSGNWRSRMKDPKSTEMLTGYDSSCIERVIKPYKSTVSKTEKYLAWTKDMFDNEGISTPWQNGQVNVKGQCNVNVNPGDYDLFYTFSWGNTGSNNYKSVDASEVKDETGNYRVKNCRIYNGIVGKNGYDHKGLPNIVIHVSDLITNPKKFALVNVNICERGDNKNSTILLRPTKDVNLQVNLVNVNLGEFLNNIIIAHNMQNVTIDTVYKNYINGSFLDVKGISLQRSVLFGYYKEITFLTGFWLLLFGSDQFIKLTGHSSWQSPIDGEYWYMTKWDNFFLGNIMAPCQYAEFSSHVNCNTFRALYNKGIKVLSSNQRNSYGSVRWGTVLGYGIGQGIKFNDLFRVTIPAAAFQDVHKINQNGVEIFNSSLSQVPKLCNVDIIGNLINGLTGNNLTSSQITVLERQTTVNKCRIIVGSSSSGLLEVYYNDSLRTPIR